MPHHITHRSVNREPVFTNNRSREVYLRLLREHAPRHGLRIAAYCLMTNHVHLLAVPEHEHSLSRTLHYVHGRFASFVNVDLDRNGHLWQNRYYSCPIDPSGVDPVAAYVELNPVRAGMTARAEHFPWSSARVHTGLAHDTYGILDIDWWTARAWNSQSWKAYLRTTHGTEEAIRTATSTGRPLGSPAFVSNLETHLQRALAPQKRGPKPRQTTSRERASNIA
jgi:putative transposase